jgi:hypothetical protein
MALVTGDVVLMPLADVVAWIANRQMSCTLSVFRRTGESSFVIRDGLVWQASSKDPREFLGQHLINFGYITEDQLQKAFETQQETHVPLGRVLVMVDAVTTEQLARVLLFKTRESLLDSMCWTDGTFKVSNEVPDERDLDGEVPIDLREVHSEGLARAHMWREIRKVFPSDATRCDVAVAPEEIIVSAFDAKLLEFLRQGRSIGETSLELRSMDFQLYARLYDLYNRQMVKPRLQTGIFDEEGSAIGVEDFDLSDLDVIDVQTAPVAPAPEPARPQVQTSPPTPAPPAAAKPAPAKPASAKPAAAASKPAPPSPAAAPAPTPAKAAPTTTTVAPSTTKPAPAAPKTPSAAPRTPARGMPSVSSTSPLEEASGHYRIVRAMRPDEPPGVSVPAEASDPGTALRVALAGRNWKEALLLSDRILEVDSQNAEAQAARRVAEVQVKRLEKESGSIEIDLGKTPVLAAARQALAKEHLTSKERYVLSRIDGKRSLQQIAAVSPIQRDELVRIVEGFVSRGTVTLQ